MSNGIQFKIKSGPLLRPRSCETLYFYDNFEENIQKIRAKIESDSLSILDKDLGPWQRMLYTSEQYKSYDDISVFTCLPQSRRNESNLNCSKIPEYSKQEQSQDSSLIGILEDEFDGIDNPIINAARNIMMQFSPNYSELDILLENTLDWVIGQYSGPSTETPMQAMIYSLLKLQPELSLATGELIHEKEYEDLPEYEPKRNAVLDAAHDLLEKTKLKPYVPCICNTFFKETLKWVISKYTGPCKYTLEKIMIKMLLKLENELDQNVTKPLKIKEINIVETANTMLKKMSYSNDLTSMMLKETLNWVLNTQNVKDKKNTITALINLEADLEQALNFSV